MVGGSTMGKVLLMVGVAFLFSCSAVVQEEAPKVPEKVIRDRLAEIKPAAWRR